MTAEPEEYVPRHADLPGLRRLGARSDRVVRLPGGGVRGGPPEFARLLADPGWLAPEYTRDAPESGMGGGIGEWLLSERATAR